MVKARIDLNDIKRYAGREIGTSRWVRITQKRVNKFAEATGDFQWFHVDREQARTELPAGQTIVHNFLLLSLVPQLFDQTVEFTNLAYGLNRGAEKVDFLEPLSTGSEVRIRLKLLRLEYSAGRGQTAIFEIIMDRKGGRKPVLTMNLRLLLVAADVRKPTMVSPLADEHQSAAFGF